MTVEISQRCLCCLEYVQVSEMSAEPCYVFTEGERLLGECRDTVNIITLLRWRQLLLTTVFL